MKMLLIFISLLVSCANTNTNRHPSSRNNEIQISKEELSKLKPKQILEMLKENSEMNVRLFFETIKKLNWSESDMAEIENYLKDETEVQPVIKSTSNVFCGQSTLAREAMHLKQAYLKGQYPLAQCSTYDLEF